MFLIRCNIHNVNYRLPETNEEFLSGKFHDDVIGIQDHIEQFPNCVFSGEGK